MTIKSRIQSIRAILLNDWDPLIVGDNPHLSDEYDDYIPAILQLLESHCTAEQMERHLTWIEKHDLGLPRLSGGIAKAAKNLITGAVAICVGIDFGAISSMTRLPDHAARSIV